MSRKLRMGLTNLTSVELVSKAKNIVTKMTDNVNFPTPTPALADVTLGITDLETAVEAAANKDRVAILVRNEKYDNLMDMMKQLGAYVAFIGNGNGAVMATSGFDLAKEYEPKPPVSTPVNFLATRDAHAGAVKLNWNSVSGARSYIIEVSVPGADGTDGVWEVAMVTTKSSAVVDNLTIGTFYFYRVKAVGTSNESPWSDISRVMAA